MLICFFWFALQVLLEPNIQPPEPNGMKNHVKHIKPLRRRMHLKMPPDLHHSPLHSYVLPRRYTRQDPLQVRNVTHRDLNRERFPVQDVAERWHVMLRNQNRDTSCVDCLNNSRTSNFVAAWTEAVLALSQHLIVGNASWKILMNLDVFIFVLPVLQEHRPNRTVKAPCKECQDRASWRGWTANQAGYYTCLEIDFRERYILSGIESLWSICITKSSNCMLV